MLTTGSEFPLPQPSETNGALQARLAGFNARLNTTAQSLFQNFLLLLVAGGVSPVAILAALAIGPERKRVEEI